MGDARRALPARRATQDAAAHRRSREGPGPHERARQHSHQQPRKHPRKRPRRVLEKACVLILALALAAQAVFVRNGVATAAETHDGDSVYLTVGDRIWYGGGLIHTARMSVNGEIAYCSDPARDAPTSGYYTREPVQPKKVDGKGWPVSSIEKVLFYGYKGPGFDATFWRSCIGGTDGKGRSFSAGKDWDGSSITNDEFLAYTHVLLAERMSSDEDAALHGTIESFRAWFCWNILGYTYGTSGSTIENKNAVAPRLEEKSVPDGFEVYQLDTGYNSAANPGRRSQTIVTFEYNPYVEVRFDKVSANATLTSGNEQYLYAGATYDIYEKASDTKVATVTTDENGRATYKLKPNTSYYAIETAAPQGFIASEKRVEFKTGSTTATVKLEDEPGTLELVIQKLDSATLGPAQAGATLEGAEYQVVDANGKTYVGTTDADGRASFEGLPFGAVTVTETKAPEGYLLDPAPHVYEISSKDMPASGVIQLEPEGDFLDDVIAFDLDLVKYQDTGAEESGLQTPAAGVEFQIISGTTGEVVATLTTDENGYATTEGGWFGAGERPEGAQGALPYDRGGYTVREVASTTPEGYRPAPDWHITAEQMVAGATLHYIVDNDFVTTRIQVVKTDAASGQSVPLAGFTFQLLDEDGNPVTQDVWYPNHEEVSEFVTDETGCVTFPGELAPGTYYIREIAAEAPYLTSGEDLAVTVENSAELAPVSVVVYADEQVTGSATISKVCSTGEMDATDSLFDAGCAGSLAGAEFDVVAQHDIVSPDGTVQAVAGQVVDHVVTGEDGTARTDGLALGSGSVTYAFVETVAPSGHALDETPHEFTLSWENDQTAVVSASVEAIDEPITITLDKTVLGSDEPLAGATFALVREDAEEETDSEEAEGAGGEDAAAETAETDEATETDETPDAAEPTEIARVVTDENGTITLRHLPAGTYRLIEVAAPDGYLVNDTALTFTVDETGRIDGSASHELTLEDDYTKIEISKRDITNEAEVPGAKLSVLDAEGNVVESWVSTEEPHLIEALPVGTYTLVEEMTPHTYDEATAVEFTVAATGEVLSVVMHDEPIEISGQLDKRQEIADPTHEGTEADALVGNGGTNRAETSVSDDGSYDYSVDFRSTSSTWVDEFTVTDDLTAASAGLADLVGITTPVAYEDYDGLLNVWYQTNLTPEDYRDESGANATFSDGHANSWLTDESCAQALGDDGRALSYDGWKLWAQDVSATSATRLSVSDLGLADGEKIVAIRLEYGRVEEGFATRSESWDRDDLKDVHDDVTDVAASHTGDELADGSERAPLIVHMRVTDDYRPDTTLTNQARVDLFRNGGGEKGLEGHDDDRVEQTPVSVAAQTPLPLPKTGEAALPLAGIGVLGVASVALALRRRGRRGR